MQKLRRVGESMTNMYPWIDETRNFIGGQCPHQCNYCYVRRSRFPQVKERYSGPVRLLVNELKKIPPSNKTIFVCDCNDLFAEKVPDFMIKAVLEYCNTFNNTWVFQSKNPMRMYNYMSFFPKKSILGTTIETNREGNSLAPVPASRAEWMGALSRSFKTYVTIEPIIDFDISELVKMIKLARPSFVNIGADSKRNKLPEPSKAKVEKLIDSLRKFTEVRLKDNLGRIL